MNSIFFNSTLTDQDRRRRLYEGELFVFSPLPSSLALCEFARDLIQEAFARLDPQEAEYKLPTREYIDIRPSF